MPPGAIISSASRTCSAKFTISTSWPKSLKSRTSTKRGLSQTLAGDHRARTAGSIETYRQLTLGKTSLWTFGAPGSLRTAVSKPRLWPACARTARAVDPHVRRTSQISRVAVALFDAFKRANSAPHSATQLFIGFCWLRLVCIALETRMPTSLPKKRAQVPAWSRHSSRMEQRRLGLLALAVRYHRGGEPRAKDGPFQGFPRSARTASVRSPAFCGWRARFASVRGDGAGLRAENPRTLLSFVFRAWPMTSRRPRALLPASIFGRVSAYALDREGRCKTGKDRSTNAPASSGILGPRVRLNELSSAARVIGKTCAPSSFPKSAFLSILDA